MLASIASLYYLRHTRLCAACAANARSTSSTATAVLWSSAALNVFFGVLQSIAFLFALCLMTAWHLVLMFFEFITPAELMALAHVFQGMYIDAASFQLSLMFPMLLALTVLNAAAVEAHLANIWICRWLSLAVVEALCPGSPLAIAAFVWPTFG